MIEDVGEADTDSEELGAFGGLIMALKDSKRARSRRQGWQGT
jgi:hypothetical protein